MAKEAPVENENPQAQDQASSPPATSTLFGKVKILLFVALVITVECAAAYWYMPSAEQNALLSNSALAAEHQAKLEKEVQHDENDQMEVDLGEFNVTAYQPISNTTLRIDFRLFGTILAKDQDEFSKLLEENKHRFRDQVIITLRSSEITDLTDAGLGLVKRKLLEKANRILGKPLLQSILFSDFSFIEQ
ncbi:MAG: flagellar basal body-associated FliL family protein [Thermoguttaceae bacterium]